MFSKGKVPQSLIDAVTTVTEASPVKIATPTGTKVLGRSYGNSAKAHTDQTKHSVDVEKGPKDKDLSIYKDNDNGVKNNYKRKSTGDYFAGDYKKKEEPRYKNEENSFASRLLQSLIINEEEVDAQINEVLSKDATAGDWIHDFVHSDNPKFKGKSKAQRKKMALGAYYAKQNESYEDSKDDKEEDKKEAKKAGMTVAEYEKSSKDKKEDKKEAKEKECGCEDEMKNEELKGNQYKLDKNKNGKLDSDDFKKLRKEETVDEAMQKSDVPAYLRKQKGEKPLTVADVKAPRPDSISSKEGLSKLRGEEVEQVEENAHDDADVTTDTLAGRLPGGKINSFKSFKLRVKPLDKEDDDTTKMKPVEVVPQETAARASIKTEAKQPEQDNVPFDPPYNTTKDDVVTDKSGAKHTPMSRAKDLARTAMKRIKTEMLGKAPGNN